MSYKSFCWLQGYCVNPNSLEGVGAGHISAGESNHHFIISIAFQGISLEAAVVSVKKEAEDPNYYECGMQGNTIL